ncbi:MAG: hypothetical protein IH600_03095 [Bacteroidetes bacterium]|nr:hypothetical protein [Bacteroidota bacterium]
MYTAHSTPDELLHAYIDEELPAEIEQQFYAILATDGDLRARLRQLRGIRTEARRFGTVAAPPPELTSAVFGRLGFAHSSSVRPKHLLGAALLFRQAWAPVASAAAAAILTATVIFGLQGNLSRDSTPALADRQTNTATTPRPESRDASATSNADGTQSTAVPSAAQPNAAQPSAAPSNERAANPSQSDHPAQNANASRTSASPAPASPAPASPVPAADPVQPSPDRSVAPTFAASTASPAPTTPAPAGVTTQTDRSFADATDRAVSPQTAAPQTSVPRPDTAPFDDASPATERNGGWIPTPASPMPTEDASILAQQGMAGQDVVDTRRYFPMLNQEPVLHYLSVELRGVSAASFPDVTIGTRSNPWMANMAAAVYYSDEQEDYGLEYGQEPFSQHYHGVEHGKDVYYEQNLLTSWILLGYRHRFLPVQALGSIEPYVTTSLGTTLQAWPLARAGVGLMYMPDRRVRFHLGLEGSLLAYPYQNTWFTSKRAGFTYGISILL